VEERNNRVEILATTISENDSFIKATEKEKKSGKKKRKKKSEDGEIGEEDPDELMFSDEQESGDDAELQAAQAQQLNAAASLVGTSQLGGEMKLNSIIFPTMNVMRKIATRANNLAFYKTMFKLWCLDIALMAPRPFEADIMKRARQQDWWDSVAVWKLLFNDS